MSHRGRLNVLCNILAKCPGELYSEMEGEQSEFHVGDVKYHLGQMATLAFPQVRGQGDNKA
jgi:2-oxoglutarate dehydrogenase E1 component